MWFNPFNNLEMNKEKLKAMVSNENFLTITQS